MGNEGDKNRIYNSDPFLWKFLGYDLQGKKVLDAGCATGYLSRKLAEKNAVVTRIDISSKMIKIAEKLTIESNLNVKYHSKSIHDLQGHTDTDRGYPPHL